MAYFNGENKNVRENDKSVDFWIKVTLYIYIYISKLPSIQMSVY